MTSDQLVRGHARARRGLGQVRTVVERGDLDQAAGVRARGGRGLGAAQCLELGARHVQAQWIEAQDDRGVRRYRRTMTEGLPRVGERTASGHQ